MDAERRRKKRKGKRKTSKRPLFLLLKLCSVTEQLTRRVDYRIHHNAKIHPGTFALISKSDGVLHTLFPFTAFLKVSAKQTASHKTLCQAINQLLSKIRLTPKSCRFIKCAGNHTMKSLLKRARRAFTSVVFVKQTVL